MMGGADVSASVPAGAREMLNEGKHRMAKGKKDERRKRNEALNTRQYVGNTLKALRVAEHAVVQRRSAIEEQMARRYLIETFGCQMNQHDSERMAGLLEQAGYDRTDDDRDADVIVINTCSVREKAEEKLYTRLGEIRMMGDETGSRPIVAVAGCVAQQEGERLLGGPTATSSTS